MGGDHRPAVWAEILTKYAGLSSKITLGEGMTSMGDIRPTADCLDGYGGQLVACVVRVRFRKYRRWH
jgi:hypothetical protein